MFQWLYNLIDDCPFHQKKQERCDHVSATIVKWVEHGTPMVEVTCQCGFHDRGPVYADPDTWVEHLP